MPRSKTLFVILLVLSVNAKANEASSCRQIASYKDVLRCAQEQAFEIQKADAEVKERQMGVNAASQILNPEFSVNTFRYSASKDSETDVGLNFPIELGQKRTARRIVAEKVVGKAEAFAANARLSTKAEVFLKLHRLRQVLQERSLIDDSFLTFSKLVRQYESRPQLSPEQKVNISLFRVARSDYALKKTENDEEVSSIEGFFRLFMEIDGETLKKVLPPRIKSWPQLNDNADLSKAPDILLAATELEVARAERQLIDSETWPTLQLGPTMKFANESGKSSQAYGVGFSLPLPIFSMNRGAKAHALAREETAALNKLLLLKENVSKREQLLKSYQTSVESLGSVLSMEELEEKHQSVEDMFLRGMVASSLVIEAHRSLVDFEHNRNERELAAIEAMLRIYALDGNLLEVDL